MSIDGYRQRKDCRWVWMDGWVGIDSYSLLGGPVGLNLQEGGRGLRGFVCLFATAMGR